jgi:hypothetical protein
MKKPNKLKMKVSSKFSMKNYDGFGEVESNTPRVRKRERPADSTETKEEEKRFVGRYTRLGNWFFGR